MKLKLRIKADGLVLVHGKSRRMEVLWLDRSQELLDNPRGHSSAWLSGNGEFAAWNIFSHPAEPDSSFSPRAVDALYQFWQPIGHVVGISAMGVSADGQRISFQGTPAEAGAEAVPLEGSSAAVENIGAHFNLNIPESGLAAANGYTLHSQNGKITGDYSFHIDRFNPQDLVGIIGHGAYNCLGGLLGHPCLDPAWQ
jgi:hypothetical protein